MVKEKKRRRSSILMEFIKKPKKGDIIKVYLDKNRVTFGIAIELTQDKRGYEKVVISEENRHYELKDCNFCLPLSRCLIV